MTWIPSSLLNLSMVNLRTSSTTYPSPLPLLLFSSTQCSLLKSYVRVGHFIELSGFSPLSFDSQKSTQLSYSLADQGIKFVFTRISVFTNELFRLRKLLSPSKRSLLTRLRFNSLSNRSSCCGSFTRHPPRPTSPSHRSPSLMDVDRRERGDHGRPPSPSGAGFKRHREDSNASSATRNVKGSPPSATPLVMLAVPKGSVWIVSMHLLEAGKYGCNREPDSRFATSSNSKGSTNSTRSLL